MGQLSYADDDAVAAAAMFGGDPANTWLLTVADAETSELHPAWAARARPPSRAQLLAAVAEVAHAATRQRQVGWQPVIVLWLVGHGTAEQGVGAFALLDGLLTAAELRQQVLAPLSQAAHRVHVVVDTCHAAAMVRARAVAGRQMLRQQKPVLRA